MSENLVRVFWDMENCSIPVAKKRPKFRVTEVVKNIRHGLNEMGVLGELSICIVADCKKMRAGVEAELHTIIPRPTIFDEPSVGPDVGDRKLMEQIVGWTLKNPPPATVILITSDVDFARITSALLLEKYVVILSCIKANTSSTLLGCVEVAIEWEKLIVGQIDYIKRSQLRELELAEFVDTNRNYVWWDFTTCNPNLSIPKSKDELLKLGERIHHAFKRKGYCGPVEIKVYHCMMSKEMEVEFHDGYVMAIKVPRGLSQKNTPSKTIVGDLMFASARFTPQSRVLIISEDNSVAVAKNLGQRSHQVIIARSRGDATDYDESTEIWDWPGFLDY